MAGPRSTGYNNLIRHQPSRKHAYIMLTPLNPTYIVKLGLTGEYIIFFFIYAQKQRFWVLFRTASSRWF